MLEHQWNEIRISHECLEQVSRSVAQTFHKTQEALPATRTTVADPNNRHGGDRLVFHYADLAACLLAVALSAWAYSSLPGRDPLRLLLVAPMLLFVPGYLLIEAFRSSREPLGRRGTIAAVAPGLSIAFVALLALGTAFFPSGFTPNAIVAMTTLVCIALIAAASYRRARIMMTDWNAMPPPRRDPKSLPRVAPRPTSPPGPSYVPAQPRPPGVPSVAAKRPLQVVRPGLPATSPPRPPSGADTAARPSSAQHAGADLRDQAKPPTRTYPRVVQTGR